MMLEKHKILRNSLIISAILVIGSNFYFKKQRPLELKKMTSDSLPEKRDSALNKGDKSITDTSENRSSGPLQKAEFVLVKDKNNPKAPPVYKVVVPKGMHLYDEEKMNEIAKDANIEELSHDDDSEDQDSSKRRY